MDFAFKLIVWRRILQTAIGVEDVADNDFWIFGGKTNKGS